MSPTYPQRGDAAKVKAAMRYVDHHGKPTETNAHPHLDASGKLAIVHNGVFRVRVTRTVKLTAPRRVGARIGRRLCPPLRFACQRILAETGMPRPVIRLIVRL